MTLTDKVLKMSHKNSTPIPGFMGDDELISPANPIHAFVESMDLEYYLQDVEDMRKDLFSYMIRDERIKKTDLGELNAKFNSISRILNTLVRLECQWRRDRLVSAMKILEQFDKKGKS